MNFLAFILLLPLPVLASDCGHTPHYNPHVGTVVMVLGLVAGLFAGVRTYKKSKSGQEKPLAVSGFADAILITLGTLGLGYVIRVISGFCT